MGNHEELAWKKIVSLLTDAGIELPNVIKYAILSELREMRWAISDDHLERLRQHEIRERW